MDFAGPCLTFPRVDPFLDLEAGLADALLSELEAHLVWRPLPGTSGSGGVRLGRVEGRIRYDGETSLVAAPAALQDGIPAKETTPWHERRALRVPLGGDAYASIASRTRDDEILEGEIVRGGRAERILSGRISVHNSADTLVPEAWRIEAVSRNTRLRVWARDPRHSGGAPGARRQGTHALRTRAILHGRGRRLRHVRTVTTPPLGAPGADARRAKEAGGP